MLPLFATPWAFAALVALPALTAMYLLRHSYRRVSVSSLMLWLDVAESRATGLKVRRLQTPLLFFLELLALILVAFAATGPSLEVGPGVRPLIVVLDDSFSMQAGSESSARNLAIAALKRELRPSSYASVRFVLAGTSPQALGETIDNLALAGAIFDEWRCQAPTAKLNEALALAGELGGDQARFVVVTDHKPPEEPKTGRVVWWAFGEPRPNLAIVRAGRNTRDDQDRVAFEIANFSEARRDATVVLETVPGAKEIHRDRLSLSPGEIQRQVLRLSSGAGPLKLRIVESDALDLDNQAFLVAEELMPIRVDLRISDKQLYELFDKALQATGKTLPPGKRPHLVVTDAAEATGIDSESWVVHALQEQDVDAYLGPFVLERTHPLTEGLSLAGVVWAAGKSAETPGSPVIMAGNVPLITDAESATKQHRIRIRLRPDLSTLPQTPAWPILAWNLVTWRSSELPGLRRVNLRLGETAVITARPGIDRVLVKPPTGEPKTIDVKAEQAAIVVEEPGIYEVRHDNETTTFAVSVQSPAESNLMECVTGRWGEWAEDTDAPPGLVSLTWILCLLAIAVLTVHLYLATRG
jgi:hypothetical protein